MSTRAWVVRPGDGATVNDVLRALEEPSSAIDEGRVFLGRMRVTHGETPVRVGDEVLVSEARASFDVKILARTSDLLAVEKPAGVPTIPDHVGSSHTLLAAAARAVGLAESDLHPTSRLDRDVSGVVVFALTPRGRERLGAAREAGTYARRYVALASKAPSPAHGTWTAPIGRAKDPRHRAANGRDAVHAETSYSVVAEASGVALLAVAPHTGRTHQIRVHASFAKAPLLGDRTYGGPTRVTVRVGPTAGHVIPLRRIALHAARVTVPEARGPLEARAEVPEDLREIWSALGGDPRAWDTAISCDIA